MKICFAPIFRRTRKLLQQRPSLLLLLLLLLRLLLGVLAVPLKFPACTHISQRTALESCAEVDDNRTLRWVAAAPDNSNSKTVHILCTHFFYINMFVFFPSLVLFSVWLRWFIFYCQSYEIFIGWFGVKDATDHRVQKGHTKKTHRHTQNRRHMV